MAVALRDLERGRPGPYLRVVPAPPRTPRHVFWLRRLLVLALLAGVVLVAFGTWGRVAGAPDADAALARTNLTVVLAPGETLWDLAERYAPADRDKVEWAGEIARLNDVEPQAVSAGTPLVVPIETPDVSAAPQGGAGG